MKSKLIFMIKLHSSKWSLLDLSRRLGGRAMAQAISRRLLTARVRVRSHNVGNWQLHTLQPADGVRLLTCVQEITGSILSPDTRLSWMRCLVACLTQCRQATASTNTLKQVTATSMTSPKVPSFRATVGRVNVVSTVTRLRAWRSGVRIPARPRYISSPNRPDCHWGSTHSPIQSVPAFFPGDKSTTGVIMTTTSN